MLLAITKATRRLRTTLRRVRPCPGQRATACRLGQSVCSISVQRLLCSAVFKSADIVKRQRRRKNAEKRTQRTAFRHYFRWWIVLGGPDTSRQAALQTPCTSVRFGGACARSTRTYAAEELEELFDPARAIDLYFDVVLPKTEWPTRDYSIKTLAKYLGFSWRDAHPSGAASIEWFHRWVQSGDAEIMQWILEYNEDDCRATRVLLDGIRRFAVA